MTLRLDPQIAAVLNAQPLPGPDVVLPARGDALGLRRLVDPIFDATLSMLPNPSDVDTLRFTTMSDDGSVIDLRWYSPVGRPARGPAIAYLHGGGMICGTVDNYEPLVRHYAHLTGVPFLSIGYRLAPEHPGEIPARDAFAGIRWLIDHAAELDVDADRIAVMGDSGGGGIGAGAAILARDHGIDLSMQILIFPMLDDRNTESDPHLAPTAVWTYDNNYTAWHAVLGEGVGHVGVSAVAAPARLTDFADLAPGYIEVGELDIFRDESIDYAQRMLRAGVSCELHVVPGAPHGYEWLSPDAAVSRRALEQRIRVVRSI